MLQGMDDQALEVLKAAKATEDVLAGRAESLAAARTEYERKQKEVLPGRLLGPVLLVPFHLHTTKRPVSALNPQSDCCHFCKEEAACALSTVSRWCLQQKCHCGDPTTVGNPTAHRVIVDVPAKGRLPVQLDIIRETEVNITSAMADQSDSLAAEKKNHKRSSDLLAKVQKKLASQPGMPSYSMVTVSRHIHSYTGWSLMTVHTWNEHGTRAQSTFSPCQLGSTLQLACLFFGVYKENPRW